MTVLEAIGRRYSCRAYQDKPIEQEKEKITELKPGSDDCITKPFSLEELLAGIKVVP